MKSALMSRTRNKSQSWETLVLPLFALRMWSVRTLRVTPAMESGLMDRLWELRELIA